MSIYCRYKSIITKIITLEASITLHSQKIFTIFSFITNVVQVLQISMTVKHKNPFT